jgi:hypothetical protein
MDPQDTKQYLPSSKLLKFKMCGNYDQTTLPDNHEFNTKPRNGILRAVIVKFEDGANADATLAYYLDNKSPDRRGCYADIMSFILPDNIPFTHAVLVDVSPTLMSSKFTVARDDDMMNPDDSTRNLFVVAAIGKITRFVVFECDNKSQAMELINDKFKDICKTPIISEHLLRDLHGCPNDIIIQRVAYCNRNTPIDFVMDKDGRLSSPPAISIDRYLAYVQNKLAYRTVQMTITLDHTGYNDHDKKCTATFNVGIETDADRETLESWSRLWKPSDELPKIVDDTIHSMLSDKHAGCYISHICIKDTVWSKALLFYMNGNGVVRTFNKVPPHSFLVTCVAV